VYKITLYHLLQIKMGLLKLFWVILYYLRLICLGLISRLGMLWMDSLAFVFST